MTTKLEAINSMLHCIGQSPLSTLEGTRSAFTVSAITLLDNETVNLQMKGWDFNTDYKTKLQEAVQTNKKSLEYVLIREYGEAHDKTFEMAVKIDNIIYGKGIGKSKKEAEQNAALDALNKSVVK